MRPLVTPCRAAGGGCSFLEDSGSVAHTQQLTLDSNSHLGPGGERGRAGFDSCCNLTLANPTRVHEAAVAKSGGIHRTPNASRLRRQVRAKPLECVPMHRLRLRLSGRQHRYSAPSTATRLWNKAQGWTAGTTLGSFDGGALNPNGVVADGQRRRLVFQPPGHNPAGVEGSGGAVTQGWHRANPGLCGATPLAEIFKGRII